MVRGSIARRKVRQRYGFECKTIGFEFGQAAEPNYDNETVANIRDQLGDYDFDEYKPSPDGVQKVFKDLVTMENGAKYEGEWRVIGNGEDVREGRGKQVWADGSLYEGYWKNDKANGHGRLIHADGDVYQGEW